MAFGLCAETFGPSELITAIQKALRGKTYVTPLLAGEIMQFYKENTDLRDAASKITPRQREVLQLLAEGHSAKEIASILNISSRTVEFHKYRMMEDLDLKSAAELIRYAIKHGLAGR